MEKPMLESYLLHVAELLKSTHALKKEGHNPGWAIGNSFTSLVKQLEKRDIEFVIKFWQGALDIARAIDALDVDNARCARMLCPTACLRGHMSSYRVICKYFTPVVLKKFGVPGYKLCHYYRQKNY